MQINDLYLIELFEIELFNHLTVCKQITDVYVVVMPRTILPWRNIKCALSATGTWKPEEEKDARGVTYFIEENVKSPREEVRFNEHIRN